MSEFETSFFKPGSVSGIPDFAVPFALARFFGELC
ncbi:hypothetical protein Pan161_30720 [Gimesia algae]|uniref:Uncharacterized protein n=1 Tax=Gimesia algae TaxID=2527971 RepID=A0A517VEI9_9PLAN|nr:hypothetical protein Pan161_30720 [Gimesia algae]